MRRRAVALIGTDSGYEFNSLTIMTPRKAAEPRAGAAQ